MMRLGIVLASLCCVVSHAFLPPVPALVRDAFDGRKPRRASEVVLRHHVEVRPGETVEIEERIALAGSKPLFLFKAMGQGQPLFGTWERRQYQVEDKAYGARSGAFLKYFLGTSPDDFLNALVAEGYVRRDQLAQFKAGWVPEGDPNTWDVRGNYLRHPDIFLSRLKHGTAVAVIGSDDGGNRRAVYFDPAGKGIRRLEWKEGGGQLAWEFDGFHQVAKEGMYPRFLYYEVNGDEKIRSELLAVRVLSDRGASEFSAAQRRPRGSVPSNVDAALQLLLGLR